MPALPSVITNADASQPQSTPATSVANKKLVSYQAKYTGSPQGAFVVYGSNDYDDVSKTGTWTDVSSLAVGALSVTAAGDTLISIANVTWRYSKLAWVPTGGSGALTVTVEVKEGA